VSGDYFPQLIRSLLPKLSPFAAIVNATRLWIGKSESIAYESEASHPDAHARQNMDSVCGETTGQPRANIREP